jgi:hypothetical protein
MRSVIARKHQISKAALRRLNSVMIDGQRDGHNIMVVRANDLQMLLGSYERELFADAAAWPAQAELPMIDQRRQRTVLPERLRKFGKVNAERVYLAAWKIENRRRSYVNGGFAALELLLAPKGKRAVQTSRRDELVAATVIAWLGTNVGGSFVRRCEARIRELEIEDSARREARFKAEAEQRRRDAEREARAKKGPKTRPIDLS